MKANLNHRYDWTARLLCLFGLGLLFSVQAPGAVTVREPTVSALRGQLTNPSEEVRFDAAYRLAELKDATALPELREALVRFRSKMDEHNFSDYSKLIRLVFAFEHITGKNFGSTPPDQVIFSEEKGYKKAIQDWKRLVNNWAQWWAWQPEANRYQTGVTAAGAGDERTQRVRDSFGAYLRGEEIAKADRVDRVDVMGIPKFVWSDIPILLELAESTRNAKRIPQPMLSSYIQSRCREGMIALWLIEGIRREQARLADRRQTGEESGSAIPATHSGHFRLPLNVLCRRGDGKNTENSPQLHDDVLQAYKNWWQMVNSLPPMEAAVFYPLDLTDLEWAGGDRRMDPLKIYDKPNGTGTVAQRTVRAWQYTGDGYQPGCVLQTIYYTLKDPSATPPFTKEMLMVHKTVLHFYDKSGTEIRTEEYFPLARRRRRVTGLTMSSRPAICP